MSKPFTLIKHGESLKKGDLPMPMLVSLALGSHGSDDKGNHYLTEQLASDKEIDMAFDHLLKELELERERAKQILFREIKNLYFNVKYRTKSTSKQDIV